MSKYIPSIHIQFQQAFGDIKFKAEDHSYTVDGKPYTSVTTVLKRCKPFFDAEYWKRYKVIEADSRYTISPRPDTRSFIIDGNAVTFDWACNLETKTSVDDLQKIWNLLAKIGTTRGTILHDYLENKWKCKEIPFQYPSWVSELDTKGMSQLHTSVIGLKKLGDEFYNTFRKTHIPVMLEAIVYDKDLGISGTFDGLFWNIETEEYIIVDYKTDKTLSSKSRDKFKLFNLIDTPLNKYALQLGIYKFIIERNTDIRIGKLNIVHFDWKDNTYNTIECNDYSKLIANELPKWKEIIKQ